MTHSGNSVSSTSGLNTKIKNNTEIQNVQKNNILKNLINRD